MRIKIMICLIMLFGMVVNAQESSLVESKIRGSEIYAEFCVVCHLPSGLGISGVFPPLAKSDFLLKNRNKIIQGLKYGLQGEITVNKVIYNGMMPALGLSDDEVADVLNYVSNNWGNQNKKIFTEAEVTKIQKDDK